MRKVLPLLDVNTLNGRVLVDVRSRFIGWNNIRGLGVSAIEEERNETMKDQKPHETSHWFSALVPRCAYPAAIPNPAVVKPAISPNSTVAMPPISVADLQIANAPQKAR